MKISIGADHRGFQLKKTIIALFGDIDWVDVGTDSTERVDYPVYAKRVCENIKMGTSLRGIIICGSGIGACMAANRYKNIYAALCWSPEIARVGVEDDKANVLVLPADFITLEQAQAIINMWLTAHFKGGRYQARLDMIDE